MTTINIETIRNVFAAAMLQEMRMVSELFFESSGILYPEEFTGEYWHQRDNQETEWVSLLVSCSRNCSHEFVRHRYRTAVSQRSTRYCDEAQSMFVEHPLSCCDQVWDSIPYSLRERICERAENIGYMQRTAYSELCYIYENYLRGVGMRGTPARKQARGAARAILPSCLETEFLFSASVSQWKRMLNARLTDAADAEIRMLFAKILDELQHSNYANRFDNVILVPAEDDFGVVLAEPFDIESKD